jgi:adenylate cyclase class 2
MAVEIEAKIRVKSFDAVRRRLAAAGGKRLARVWERNLILDKNQGELEDRGQRLRLRLQRDLGRRGHRPVLTFKGRRRKGAFKSREEIEVAVADSDQMIRLLGAMGYRGTFDFEKRRESWRLGECRVELDVIPFLGRFVEIEGADEHMIQRAIESLGLDGRKVIRKGYVSLLRRHLRRIGAPDRAAMFKTAAAA